jgi:hypothetical protein
MIPCLINEKGSGREEHAALSFPILSILFLFLAYILDRLLASVADLFHILVNTIDKPSFTGLDIRTVCLQVILAFICEIR